MSTYFIKKLRKFVNLDNIKLFPNFFLKKYLVGKSQDINHRVSMSNKTCDRHVINQLQ